MRTRTRRPRNSHLHLLCGAFLVVLLCLAGFAQWLMLCHDNCRSVDGTIPFVSPCRRQASIIGTWGPRLSQFVAKSAPACSANRCRFSSTRQLGVLVGGTLSCLLAGARRKIKVAAGDHGPQTGSPHQFVHLDQRWPILRGDKMSGEHSPVAFLSASDKHLAEYIRDDPAGPFHDELQWTPAEEREGDEVRGLPQLQKWNFTACPREPFLLKADWHSVHGWGKEFDVFVPRNDAEQSVRRAPLRILAFLEAFRKVNRSCWHEMQSGLEVLAQKGENDFDRQRLLKVLIDSFSESGHFGAVEVQAGPADKRRSMRWHRDGATGLLHLAITLGGRRTLQFRAGDGEQDWRNRDVQMSVGNFYISMPFLFDHSVTYDAQAGQSTLAIMCRFAFLDEKDALWINHIRGPDMLEAAQVIATCLKDAADKNELRLPSMQDVLAMEKMLAEPSSAC